MLIFMKMKLRNKLLAALTVTVMPVTILLGAAPATAAGAFVKYSWSSTLYTSYGNDVWNNATPYQWQQAGSPAPITVNWINGSTLLRNTTSTSEIFIEGPSLDGEDWHHLTGAQFSATGRPASQIQSSGMGFHGYTWNSNITWASGGQYRALSYENWTRAWDSPTPSLKQRYAGDSFCRVPSTGAIYWSNTTRGINNAARLTPAQYAGAGSPSYSTC